MPLGRLDNSHFRTHRSVALQTRHPFVILHGPNGAGKTNILEAVSLLVPGRGLRRAAFQEMALRGGDGSFAISAELDGNRIGTAVEAANPNRRIVHINGATASAASLAEWLAVLWVTPAMDRIFVEGATGRRRFLDRLVLALDPGHAVAKQWGLKKSLGIPPRVTFVFDKTGVVRHRFDSKVRFGAHVETALEIVKTLR